MKIITRLFGGIIIGIGASITAFFLLSLFLFFAFVILCMPIMLVGMFSDLPKPSSENIEFALEFVYLLVGVISCWNSFFCVLFDKKNKLHAALTLHDF